MRRYTEARVFAQQPAELTAGTLVLDLRGMRGFNVILDATGAGTSQMCNADGSIPAGAPAAAALVEGTLVSADWPFYLLTWTAGTITVAIV